MLNVEVDFDKDFIPIYVFVAAYFPKGLPFVIPLFLQWSKPYSTVVFLFLNSTNFVLQLQDV